MHCDQRHQQANQLGYVLTILSDGLRSQIRRGKRLKPPGGKDTCPVLDTLRHTEDGFSGGAAK